MPSQWYAGPGAGKNNFAADPKIFDQKNFMVISKYFNGYFELFWDYFHAGVIFRFFGSTEVLMAMRINSTLVLSIVPWY